jgi:imidazolonepropionase-like amidohydrolase
MRKIQLANTMTRFTLLMIAILLPASVRAHDQIPGAPQTKPIVIVGATIHPISSPPIRGGKLLFEDGKITALGKSVKLPKGVVKVDASEMHVFPGMIDAMSDLGLREISAVDVTIDSDELGSTNPNVRSWVAVNPDSELIPVTRANGVLTSMVAPRGNGIRGQSAVLALDGWTAADMTIKAPAGVCIDWDDYDTRGSTAEERAKARQQRLGKLDDLLEETRRYVEARQSDPQRTPVNLRLESLRGVIEGDLPVFAEADTQREIESAVMYAQSRELKLVIVGGYDAERCATLLNRYDVPVIITETYRLPRYRHDPYDASYTLPDRLHRAGVRFAICGQPGNSSNARNLPYHAGNAVAYGLSLEEAYRSVTLSPAEILGVDDKLGSLEAGKFATLVIASGSILEGDTEIVDAYIQGRKVDLSSRHTMLYEKYKIKYERQ